MIEWSMIERIIMDIGVNLEYIWRIVLACICGTLLGYERERRKKEAGIRTHSIVAIGACLLMIISKYGFPDQDGTRIASNIVTGISFLGAGVIFMKKGTIQGLTTAAGLWTTAGISMALGSGMYVLGVFTTILILFIQIFYAKQKSIEYYEYDEIEVVFCNTDEYQYSFRTQLEEAGIHVYEITMEKREDKTICMRYYIGYKTKEILWEVARELLEDEQIIHFKI